LSAVEIDQLILQAGIGGRYLVSQLDPLLRHQKKSGSGYRIGSLPGSLDTICCRGSEFVRKSLDGSRSTRLQSAKT
jgi:hypothetical protein